MEEISKELKDDIKSIVKTVNEIQITMARSDAKNEGEHTHIVSMIKDAQYQLKEYKEVSDTDDSKIVKALKDQSIVCDSRFKGVETVALGNKLKLTYAMGILVVIIFLINLIAPIIRDQIAKLFGM